MVLWHVWIRTLDLDKTLGANVLVTAASAVEVWGVVKEANGTLGRFFVEYCLDGTAVDKA